MNFVKENKKTTPLYREIAVHFHDYVTIVMEMDGYFFTERKK